MNRITTTLCVMTVLAMATLALPTPSYPSNAFSGFAEVLVCLKSRFSAAAQDRIAYMVSSIRAEARNLKDDSTSAMKSAKRKIEMEIWEG